MDRRWAKMRRLTLDALGHSDVLGLSANPLSIMQSAQLRASTSHAPVAGQDKVKAFQGWMDAGLHQVVFGYSGTWLHPYIEAAVEIAKRRAAGLVAEKAVADAGPEDEPRDKEGKWTAEGNETLSYLLGPKSSVGEIGKETGKVKSEGVSVLSLSNSPVGYSGHRLVYAKGGNIVGAMQLMKSPSNDRHIVANVFVHPEYRRQGIASKLDSAARARFGQLDLSKYESEAGKAFIKTIKDAIFSDAAPRANRLDTMCSLATTELQGICEAVSQQACRELAAGLLQGKTPKRIAARVANRVARVGKVRGRMLANTIVVSTHAGATLDEFRARGITHVGTKAERGHGVRKRSTDALVMDRRSDDPSAYAIGKAERAEHALQEEFEGELVQVETAGDDDVCEICQDLEDEGPFELDEAESLIPAHPNAVLEGTTIASYGPMRELVSATFNGPAVRLRTNAQEFAIGPNHPMLTRRGFVKASELNEGDDLLYDVRMDSSTTARSKCTSPTNFKQMPLVEDVFLALSLRGQRSGVAAHLDFHGDRIFCKGEVKVVYPEGNLLPVFDLCGIEQFCEMHLMRANMALPVEATDSAFRQFFDRCLSTASSVIETFYHFCLAGFPHLFPSDMKLLFQGANGDTLIFEGSDDRYSVCPKASGKLLERHSAAIEVGELFRWDRVVSVRVEHFSGLAFDASTQTGLYNNNGYLVKNCRCAFVPSDDARFADVRELDT